MENLERRKVLVVLDLETEKAYNLHGSDLALALESVISHKENGIGVVHNLTVYEQRRGEDLNNLVQNISDDIKDGYLK